MKLLGVLIVSALVLMGCAKEKETVTQTQVIEVPVPVEVPVVVDPTEEQEIATIVAQKNEFRNASGLVPLTPGLTCTLHESSNPDLTVALPGAKYTFAMFKPFNHPNGPANIGVNILPDSLQLLYSNNYVVRCQGQIVVLSSGYYHFRLSSDDGSMLYIDNVLTVNNNGNHGIQAISGSKLLERGVHTFKLDYAQTGAGSMALILEGDETLLGADQKVIPANRFYR